MSRYIVLLIVLLLPAVEVQAEFVVKYFIDGHIVAPAGHATCTSSATPDWVAEMDGDLSSPEMLAVRSAGTSTLPYWSKIGIAHILTGETDWIDPTQTGYYPMTAVDANTISTWRLYPLFIDVDLDGLSEVLVPVLFPAEGSLKTAVIGWQNGSSASPPVPNPSTGTLLQARPNPFQRGLSIEFSVHRGAEVRLSIFDVEGRVVKRLVEETLNSGDYTITWDGQDDEGHRVPVGTYFYRLEVDGEQRARRVLLVQ